MMRQFVHLGPAFEFDGAISHDVLINGKLVADLVLTLRDEGDKRHAVVEWFGKRGPLTHTMATGPNAFGPKFVRQVLRAIRDTHKVTGSITGKRISGFREKRRGEAVNEYGEPLPLPPVVDAPFDKKATKLARLRLRPAETRTSIAGDLIHSHTIEDDSGIVHGTLEVVPRNDGRHLHIHDFAHKSAGPSRRDGWNALGVSGVRDVMSHLAEHYPDAEFVSGFRASGTAARGGNVAEDRHVVDMTRFRDKAKQRAVKLSRVGRWLRGLIDSFRDELHESLGRDGPTPGEAKAHQAKVEARVKAGELKREQAEAEAARVYEAQKTRYKARVAAAVTAHADKHHEAFAKAFGITDRAAAHAKLTKLLTRAVAKSFVDEERTTFVIRKKGLPVAGGPLGDRTGRLTITRKLARPSALLKTAPSDLWALLERIHTHHETKLTPDVALNGALADMIDELNGTGHEDPRSTVVRGAGRLDAFGGVYHPALSGAIYHYPAGAISGYNVRANWVRAYRSGGSEMSLGFTTKNRSALSRGGHVRVPTVQWNVKTPAKVHADKKSRDLVFFKPFLTPEGEVDVHGLHEFIDRLPKHARPSWRKAAEENGHPDPREKPVKLMGGFAGGTNTDVPNLVKKPVVKLARPSHSQYDALVKSQTDAPHSVTDAQRGAFADFLEENGLPGAHVARAHLPEHRVDGLLAPLGDEYIRQQGGPVVLDPEVNIHEKVRDYLRNDSLSLPGTYPVYRGRTTALDDRRGHADLAKENGYAPTASLHVSSGSKRGVVVRVRHYSDAGHAVVFDAHAPTPAEFERLLSDLPPQAQEHLREALWAHTVENGAPWLPVRKPRKKLARQRFAGEGSSVAVAGSANHEARLKVAKQILADSGLTPAEVRAAVLHASGSTRPALAAVIAKSAHPDHVKYTAAWLGLATQQPGVAVATVDPAGRDTLHVLHVGEGYEGMTRALKRAGVEKFTVESGKGGGHRIWVLNPNGKYPVKQLAQVNNARHSSVRVSVTRLGSGSSADAAGGTASDAKTRAAYREAIDAFERAGA